MRNVSWLPLIVQSNVWRIEWKHQKPEVQRNLEYSQVKKNRYTAFVAAKERLLSHENQSVSSPAPISVEDLTATPYSRNCDFVSDGGLCFGVDLNKSLWRSVKSNRLVDREIGTFCSTGIVGTTKAV